MSYDIRKFLRTGIKFGTPLLCAGTGFYYGFNKAWGIGEDPSSMPMIITTGLEAMVSVDLSLDQNNSISDEIKIGAKGLALGAGLNGVGFLIGYGAGSLFAPIIN
jgi:hypothetical protein